MRRLPAVSLMILLAFTLSISGCVKSGTPVDSTPEAASTAEKQVSIVTSFYPMYIMTLNITRDIPGVKVTNLTRPTTGCLHDYQLTPEDMKNLEGASIFVVNGAGMESFLDKAVKQQPDLKLVEASRGIPLIRGEEEEEDNPHVWVSISGAIQQVRNIGTQLAALDQGRADRYRANTEAYVKKLESLRDRMHQALDPAKTRDIVTFHEAFPYFAQEFKLNTVAVVEREPGSEPSAAELADTIETVKQSRVKALFAEPQYPAKAADTIARETGARVYILDPAVTGPLDPDAYINIMEANLKTLQEALN
ncbi:MAG: zinc ABC transporter solute-binding protein [Firmicutes bacterium]|nr:zinc ABC transporter solute-binding protein [Bacillota bacterium]